MCQKSAIRGFWIVVALLSTLLTPANGSAQETGNGWTINLYGTVQVEPGSNVIVLQVKDEKIRFAIQNVHCADRNFSAGRFMTDVARKEPALYMKGSEESLDVLINERPNKRVLQMSGVYFPESRLFMIHKLAPFTETPGLQPR